MVEDEEGGRPLGVAGETQIVPQSSQGDESEEAGDGVDEDEERSLIHQQRPVDGEGDLCS